MVIVTDFDRRKREKGGLFISFIQNMLGIKISDTHANFPKMSMNRQRRRSRESEQKGEKGSDCYTLDPHVNAIKS